MSVKLLPYKAGSQSAKALAEALGIKRLKLKGSKWKAKPGDTVINWGGSAAIPADAAVAKVLNHPRNIVKASNKLNSQRAFEGSDYCLPYATTLQAARNWIAHGKTVVCRTKLTGNSGEGIVIAETADQLVEAPLYTVYKKKKQEYRVHVFSGEVISVQRKARKKDVPDDDVNWQVRNLDGGFIFARTGFDVPQSVVDAAKGAMKDLGLDFGAVDVGYHDKEGTYVYEVNTACGLDGSNLTDYVEAFCKKLNLPVPKRPADYVPPTLPGQPQVAGVAEEPEVGQRREVLTNRQVIDMVRIFGADKIGCIKRIRERTGVDLKTAVGMYDRAAADAGLVRRDAPQPMPEAVPAPKPAPKGSKENPLGNYVEGAKLRQIRPDLHNGMRHVVPNMVDEYAGKWVYLVTPKGQENDECRYKINGKGQWVWSDEMLVPTNDILIKVGNVKKVLNLEEQAKVAEFLLKL